MQRGERIVHAIRLEVKRSLGKGGRRSDKHLRCDVERRGYDRAGREAKARDELISGVAIGKCTVSTT